MVWPPMSQICSATCTCGGGHARVRRCAHEPRGAARTGVTLWLALGAGTQGSIVWEMRPRSWARRAVAAATLCADRCRGRSAASFAPRVRRIGRERGRTSPGSTIRLIKKSRPM
eukprot:6555078-Prymnesium_polylepis.1